mgnify:CR=1 FL=1
MPRKVWQTNPTHGKQQRGDLPGHRMTHLGFRRFDKFASSWALSGACLPYDCCVSNRGVAQRRYEANRSKTAVPHVPIRALRVVAGITLDELARRIEEETGHRYTRGALSGIEGGHRGASAELLRALEIVYGLAPGDIDTQYKPRKSTASLAA